MKGKERIYHSDGEYPGATVDFGARLDDEKTKQEIEERNLGVLTERSSGDGRQLIVKTELVPLPVKWKLVGVALLGASTIYGSYRLAKWVMRMRDKEHFETKKKQSAPKAVDKS